MSRPTCRLLPYEVADGPHNMAADEALLESAVQGVASLRFYGWSGPTVSLGYFQPAAVRLADPLVASLPYVRRPSGGDTLVHHHEVTYCLALPAGKPWQDGQSWLCRMHRIIASALASLGVEARLCAPEGVESEPGFLCFLRFTPGDLMIGRHKVVGSAQRKRHQSLMQHGGILLVRSPHTPALAGVGDLSAHPVTAPDLIDAVCASFVADTGCDLLREVWTPDERTTIEALVATRYGGIAWNDKR